MNIVTLGQADLAAFFLYMNDHLSDNGRGDTALFQPMPRSESFFPSDREEAFRAGLATPLGEAGWRRAWIALDMDGMIAGHVDLRARPERTAAHRCLLGMGVHRAHRKAGLGTRLLDTAYAWALNVEALEWIDLEVLSLNGAARALYERNAFVKTGEIPALFRLNGEDLAYTYMTRKLG
ncbi:MAG: GNAT family N-acetyltransferase [Pseudomonadota bacterium]